jgi:hypothetical protein
MEIIVFIQWDENESVATETANVPLCQPGMSAESNGILGGSGIAWGNRNNYR